MLLIVISLNYISHLFASLYFIRNIFQEFPAVDKLFNKCSEFYFHPTACDRGC